MACSIAHQGEGQCTHATGDRISQRTGCCFGAGMRVASLYVATGQVIAILGQVQGFLVDRHFTVGAGDQLAVQHFDRNGRGALVTIGVTNGVDKGVRRPRRQILVGVGVIGGIALGIQGQVAVLAVDRVTQMTAGRGGGVVTGAYTHHVLAIATDIGTDHIVGQHVAADAVALADMGEIAMGFGHIVDDADHDGAGGGVAQRVLHLVGEAVGDHVRAIVDMVRRVRRRGQGIGVAAIGVQQDLAVLACSIAHQGEGQCTHATGDRISQRTGCCFGAGMRVASLYVATGQVIAILGQVQGFLVDRHFTVGAGDQLAVQHLDRDGRGALVTIGITDGVDEGVRRPWRQILVGVGVVGGVALGIQGQVAVLAVDRVT